MPNSKQKLTNPSDAMEKLLSNLACRYKYTGDIFLMEHLHQEVMFKWQSQDNLYDPLPTLNVIHISWCSVVLMCLFEQEWKVVQGLPVNK